MTFVLGLLISAIAAAQTQGHWLNGGQTTGLASPGAGQLSLVTNGTAALVVNGSSSVGIGTGAPAALLDLTGVGALSALLLPRDTTANRPGGLNGMLRYNTTTAAVESYAGGAWASVGAGGGTPLSALTAASATNAIDGQSNAQTWAWSTATTQNPLTITAAGMTTGSAVAVTASGSSLASTNGVLQVANLGASTSGLLATLQSNSTAASGLTILASGAVGIGTAAPASTLSVAGGVRIANDPGACTSAKAGTIRYAGGSPAYQYCNGSAWTPLTSSSTGCQPSEAIGNLSNAKYGLWSDGTYIYSTDHSKIYAYTWNGTTATQVGVATLSRAENVWGDGTYIYVTTYGTKIVYAYTFNGTTFSQKASVTVTANATDVYCDGTYIYISNGKYISAYTFNGTAFTAAGTVYSLTGATMRRIRGSSANYLAVAAGGKGLLIFTFNGSTFSLKAQDAGDGSSNQIAMGYDGTYYYLGNIYGDLSVYTYAGGSSLTPMNCNPGCQPPHSGGISDITFSGNNMYTAVGTGMKVYTTFGSGPYVVLKGAYTNYIAPWAVLVKGSYVFQSDTTEATSIFNLCN